MTHPAFERDEYGMTGRQFGRYEILTKLASGGMGTVYVARSQGIAGFERLVAVKLLHPHLAEEQEFISMFLDEARLAARIRHPNIVSTVDFSDSFGDGFFLVMEYIEGDHLGSLLGRMAKKGRRLPAPVVLRIVLDALEGLCAAHQLSDDLGDPLRLVHRDISPHNILIGVDGIGRLSDFGVAKAEIRIASTQTGHLKGKLPYMAPEHASTGEAEQRSDLFSMGIVLWEALAGRRLFKSESSAATLMKILNDPIPAPSEIWPDLKPFDALLAKALQRDPEKRFQSAQEFLEALEAAGTKIGIAPRRVVADAVRHIATDKLRDEKDRIREALDQVGFGPLDSSLERASASRSGVTPRIHEGATMIHRPSARRKRRIALYAAGTLLAALIGGTIAWFISSARQAPEQNVAVPVSTEQSNGAKQVVAVDPDKGEIDVSTKTGSAVVEPEDPQAQSEIETTSADTKNARSQRRQSKKRRSKASKRGNKDVELLPQDYEDLTLTNPYRR